MSEKKRADVILVSRQIFESREKARTAIMEGRVFQGERRIMKPSEIIAENAELIVRNAENEYVSRGALKLEKAVRVFHADFLGKVVVDVGSSTGGFTDVCLRNGAKHVFSVDVGYGQLDWKLRNDPRVSVMERTNARYLEPEMFSMLPDVAVMDVSFISIRLILPVLIRLLGDAGIIYTLIKPQFEAGREKVGKNGVVREPSVHEEVLESIVDFSDSLGWPVVRMDYSPITGPKGNIEFIAEIRKNSELFAAFPKNRIHDLVTEAHQSLIQDRQKGGDAICSVQQDLF